MEKLPSFMGSPEPVWKGGGTRSRSKSTPTGKTPLQKSKHASFDENKPALGREKRTKWTAAEKECLFVFVQSRGPPTGTVTAYWEECSKYLYAKIRSSRSEMRALQEERKALLAISSELNAQLQRLKIEELALISLTKLEDERTQGNQENSTEHAGGSKDLIQRDEKMDDNTRLEDLDLSLTKLNDMDVEEEEDEEESEEEPDQLTMFMNHLINRSAKNDG